jgi:hypothetical protein
VLRIHCPACRREVYAVRCSIWDGRRGEHVWANRCVRCGATYEAPDPSRAGKRKRARRHLRQLRELVAAGQIALFPEVRR